MIPSFLLVLEGRREEDNALETEGTETLLDRDLYGILVDVAFNIMIVLFSLEV
eukprot:CAMPEP_0195516786 /NCGR_PEP_ID=MMETSP0794_2-20130614/8662_1 /TAXON_ID=515487 /ORGANISM="Stephanopyxis turris, Strain CCMP 815" /LENGTH=52 /DNA_ID=CAMNT_0040645469 /DNA_START=68 /DNA_END=226 /DNA_ORIENTATION=-